MIIDSHNHVCFHNLDANGVVSELDAFDISTAWLLTWYHPPLENAPPEVRAWSPTNMRPDGTHAGQTLNQILEACNRYPDRFVAGYCPCPAEGHAAGRCDPGGVTAARLALWHQGGRRDRPGADRGGGRRGDARA